MSAELPPKGRNQSARLHPVEWAVESGATGDVMRRMELRLRQRRRRRWRDAGVAIMAVAVGILGWKQWPRSTAAEFQAHSTTAVIVLPRQQKLEDGTVVELKTGASIRPDFSTALRRVILERGQAHFQVTKNPARPFVVVAGATEVQAVGTAFSVGLTEAATEVVVTEGRVAVSGPTPAATGTDPAGEASREPTLLEVGDHVVIEGPSSVTAAAPRVARLTPDDLAGRLAWRTPVLEFSGTPLEAVLLMINRFRTVKLVLAEARLGSVRISGVLRTDNSVTLLRLLEEEHGIRATPRGEFELVLAQGSAR